MDIKLKALIGAEFPNPIAITRAFDSETGKAWREYEPEELAARAGVPTVQSYLYDLVMACQMAATNPDCFDDWHAFHHVATVFNHRRASFEFLDALSYIEAAWACTVLRTLNPRHEFGLGVQRYVSALCMHDGVLFFPWIGGAGLNLCTFYPLMGMLDSKSTEIVDDVMGQWKSGQMEDVAPSDVTDTNAVHVQLAKLVSGQEYIRKCSGNNIT